VTRANNGIVISQRKYVLDVLEEIGLMNSKFLDTPMDCNAKLHPWIAMPNFYLFCESHSDPKKY